jgi:hypothetical protein
MARKTITTYTCDACEQTVERPRDLRKITVVGVASSGRNRYRDAPSTELCDTCEAKLLGALAPFFPENQAENLVMLRREPPKS